MISKLTLNVLTAGALTLVFTNSVAAYQLPTHAVMTASAVSIPDRYNWHKVGKPWGVPVTYVAHDKLLVLCNLVHRTPGTELYGCAISYTDGSWRIYGDKNIGLQDRPMFELHEYAHVLGMREH